MSRPKCVVLGSAHVDLIASAARLPEPGASVVGDRFVSVPGGKAANQAAQLARCGVDVALISRLGDDAHGAMLRSALGDAGVSLTHVATDPETATGASVVLAAQGDYASIIVPGAAGRLSVIDVEAAAAAIEAADALVLQLEIPTALSEAAAKIASAVGVTVVLNASPAPDIWAALPRELRDAVAVLVVNRPEAIRLLGGDVSDATDDALAQTLHRTTQTSVVMTLGADGALVCEDDSVTRIPPFKAEVVDSVGAGDAFLGAFLAMKLNGAPLTEALRHGAAAGAIAVTRPGAFSAQPDRREIDAFLAAAAPP